MARVTAVLVDDFAFLRPQGVLQVGKVLLLPMSVVLGDCCPTSLILKKQDVCKSEELKVSEKEKNCIKNILCVMKGQAHFMSCQSGQTAYISIFTRHLQDL